MTTKDFSINWTALSLLVGLVINAAVGVWFASSAFAKLEAKMDYLIVRMDKMETHSQTKEQARADARIQETFNNMYDVRLRVVEETLKQLGRDK